MSGIARQEIRLIRLPKVPKAYNWRMTSTLTGPTKGTLHTYSKILEQLSHRHTQTQAQPSSDLALVRLL